MNTKYSPGTPEYDSYLNDVLDYISSIKDSAEIMKNSESFIDEHYEFMTNFQRARAFMLLAKAMYDFGYLEELRSVALTGLRVLELSSIVSENLNKSYSLKSKLLNILALSYFHEGKFFMAAKYFSESFETALLSNDVSMEAFVINNLGNSYIFIGDYDKAAEMFLFSLDILEKSDDVEYRYGKALISMNLAIAYSGLNNIDLVKKYYKKSKDYAGGEKFALLELFLRDLESYMSDLEDDEEASNERFNVYLDAISKSGENYRILSMIIIYISRMANREKIDFERLHKLLYIMKDFLSEYSTPALEALISLLDFEKVLEENKKDTFEEAYDKYISLSSKYSKTFLYERAEAFYKQLEELLLNKEKEVLTKQRTEAIDSRCNMQLKEEKIHSEYSNLRLINSIAGSVRGKAVFEKNMLTFAEGIKKKIDYEHYAIWVLPILNKSVEKYVLIDCNSFERSKCRLEDLDEDVLKVIKSKTVLTFGDGNNILVPVMFDDTVIAVISIAVFEGKRITSEDLNFVVSVLGYVSISVYSHIYRLKIKVEEENYLCLKKDLENAKKKLVKTLPKDCLTGVSSRKYYDSNVLFLIRRIVNEKKKIAIMMFVIDDFYEYYDEYGSSATDNLIEIVAVVLDDKFKGNEGIFARYYSHKFIAAMPIADFEEENEFAESARRAVESLDIPNTASRHNIVTVSIGSAAFSPKNVSDLKSIEKAAQNLMYMAMDGGGNKAEVRLFESFKKREKD